uniref:DNA-directed RNA polymerase n=1 Tax=Volvocales sp. NrCl902 TaxID=2682054 RepID=A0A7G1GG96_9CHLO|nr:RNA polymerase beta'' subunit [Volvocales sp. NrCl902]
MYSREKQKKYTFFFLGHSLSTCFSLGGIPFCALWTQYPQHITSSRVPVLSSPTIPMCFGSLYTQFSATNGELRKPSVGIGYKCKKGIVRQKRERSATSNQRSEYGQSIIYWNQSFDKGRIKNFVSWFILNNNNIKKAVQLVDLLKKIGFSFATKAGISLGIDDLKIPTKKNSLLFSAEKIANLSEHLYNRAEITGVERYQRLISIYHQTSEILKKEVIDNFSSTDLLNPVYMMAFSGARGNISQVRQLVGMRGLMADPQGEIIDTPIRSNFREGLTLTEYIISSYGARKGTVDTALKTANAGYLTRRLVDVAQHVIISKFDCGTHRGIYLSSLKDNNKIINPLYSRIIGRILAQNLLHLSIPFTNNTQKQTMGHDPVSLHALRDLRDLRDLRLSKQVSKQVKKVSERVNYKRNIEITYDLAFDIANKYNKVFVRSPLTCQIDHSISSTEWSPVQHICQLCYGWSLAHGNLVSIGEAVGVIAGQSIGEPGTQLTMRTFHTGGVFTGDISNQIRAPFDGIVHFTAPITGIIIRTPEGQIAFLTKKEGSFFIEEHQTCPKGKKQVTSYIKKQYKIPSYTLLYLRNGDFVLYNQIIAQITNIKRQNNATDDAEYIIKSEIEGQFFTQSIKFFEKIVGPILSECHFLSEEQVQEQLQGQGQVQEQLQGQVQEQLQGQVVDKEQRSFLHRVGALKQYTNESLIMDTFYQVTDWGYAWILSGKKVQLPYPSTFFPRAGDLLNHNSLLFLVPGSFRFYSPLPFSFLVPLPISRFLFHPVPFPGSTLSLALRALHSFPSASRTPPFPFPFPEGIGTGAGVRVAKKKEGFAFPDPNLLSTQFPAEGWERVEPGKGPRAELSGKKVLLSQSLRVAQRRERDHAFLSLALRAALWASGIPANQIWASGIPANQNWVGTGQCMRSKKGTVGSRHPASFIGEIVPLTRKSRLEGLRPSIVGIEMVGDNRNRESIKVKRNSLILAKSDLMAFKYALRHKKSIDSLSTAPPLQRVALFPPTFPRLRLEMSRRKLQSPAFCPFLTSWIPKGMVYVERRTKGILAKVDYNTYPICDAFLGNLYVYGHCFTIQFKSISRPFSSSGKGDPREPELEKREYTKENKNSNLKKALKKAGQLIHLNKEKMTLRRSQPIYISPKALLHKFNGDLVLKKIPVITLTYQRLKTGDIVQGIPKVEQLFEARTTKSGQTFIENIPHLLNSIFMHYYKRPAFIPKVREETNTHALLSQPRSRSRSRSLREREMERERERERGRVEPEKSGVREALGVRTSGIHSNQNRVEPETDLVMKRNGGHCPIDQYIATILTKKYTINTNQYSVRQSFYKIQQIIVEGVYRVYKSQGVNISDKHLEVIVSQMTKKVRIIDSDQHSLYHKGYAKRIGKPIKEKKTNNACFFTGELLDLDFVENINNLLIEKIPYEPVVLGITKASLETNSFLSAASFQQTARILSKAALYQKKDFLLGLKENVIIGNLIPAGTGFIAYLPKVST